MIKLRFKKGAQPLLLLCSFCCEVILQQKTTTNAVNSANASKGDF